MQNFNKSIKQTIRKKRAWQNRNQIKMCVLVCVPPSRDTFIGASPPVGQIRPLLYGPASPCVEPAVLLLHRCLVKCAPKVPTSVQTLTSQVQTGLISTWPCIVANEKTNESLQHAELARLS